MFSVIFLILTIWAGAKSLKTKHAPKRHKKTSTAVAFCKPQTISKAEMDRLRREEQRRIKELQAAEQAADELERIQALRQQYIDLLANLEQERHEATTPSKRNALTEKTLSIEGKMIRIDSRMAKLYSTANQIICIG